MMQYNVTALIVTYNPNFKKLIMTIRSFLLQKGVFLQIVIADDGSKTDYFEEVKEFFAKYEFKDYKLIKNVENVGTVQNLIGGLSVCEGEYVKPFSPGDYMSGEDVLANWIAFMEKNKYSVTGSNYVCYFQEQDEEEQVSVQKAHPQLINFSDQAQLKRSYLLNNDIFLGASVLCKKNIFIKYVELLKGSVKYMEDSSYRFMAYCNESMGFYNEITIFYEVGTGISTSGKDKWDALLRKDWVSADQIIKSFSTEDEKFKRDFIKIVNLHKFSKGEHKVKKFMQYISIRGLLFLKIRKKLKPRYTSNNLSKTWLSKLKDTY